MLQQDCSSQIRDLVLMSGCPDALGSTTEEAPSRTHNMPRVGFLPTMCLLYSRWLFRGWTFVPAQQRKGVGVRILLYLSPNRGP